ncbi:hypothetical protein HMPREF9372_0074 [Sporosarcina newyorkensis 2681]|uniref:Uncharacterized protein n=1 Tax=Sporosarcina newyorkensis 2681 TaxID=1027292 RepID=F9DMP4_9BACL|nr:hypothetical protein HMPREF9372_0074 [Sporosarcina newyorkensis 2681]
MPPIFFCFINWHDNEGYTSLFFGLNLLIYVTKSIIKNNNATADMGTPTPGKIPFSKMLVIFRGLKIRAFKDNIIQKITV